MRDTLSIERLQKLHPKVREVFKAFIEEAEKLNINTTLRIMQGLRTFAEQDVIYQQGRTKPGAIVTMAKPGYSYHNYGLAVDLCELDGQRNNVVDWKFNMGLLKGIAQKHGITWGGDFKTIKDKPHFEISFGYSVEQLLAMRNSGKVDKDGYVLI